MPDERIEIEWIGTATKMTQVLDRLERKLDKQEKQLDKIGKTSKKAAEGAAGSFNKLEQELKDNERQLKRLRVGSEEFEKQKRKVAGLRAELSKAKKELSEQPENPWPSVTMSMDGAVNMAERLIATLKKLSDTQKEVAKGGSDVATTVDTLARRLQVQQGLTDAERSASTARILGVANREDVGATADTAFRAATQLVSSGFADPVAGGELVTVLKAINASNFEGGPEALVKGFAQALQASGLEKNNANLERLAVATQGLFRTTDFQIAELTDFAKNAAVFTGANLTQEQSLAAFTALRETLRAEQASTGLRNFITTLQAGAITKESAANFARIGVNPADVDFVGESLVEVIGVIKKATDKLSEEDRNAALGKFFGKENVAAARLLLASGQRIPELERQQADATGFETAAGVAGASMQAERNRIENERLRQIAPNAERLSEINNRIARRENLDKRIVEGLVADGDLGQATIAGPALEALRVTQDTLGDRIAKTLFELMTGGEFQDIQRQQVSQQQQTNRLLEEQNRQPKPKMRPKEKPLPSTTVP